jgi:hypothetical protein
MQPNNMNPYKGQWFINLSLAVAKISGNNNRDILEYMISSNRQLVLFQDLNQN